jgi:hypothetical protein
VGRIRRRESPSLRSGRLEGAAPPSIYRKRIERRPSVRQFTITCLFPALVDAVSSPPPLFFEGIQERHKRSLPGVLGGHLRLVTTIPHPYRHGGAVSPQLPAPWLGPLTSLARDYVVVWPRCHLGSLRSGRAEASLGHIACHRWPDDARLPGIEDRFTCTACGHRGADVRSLG